MSATAIANACDQQGETHDAREKEYLSIINRYTKAEQQTFPELLAKLVEALEEDPEQDFLGKIRPHFPRTLGVAQIRELPRKLCLTTLAEGVALPDLLRPDFRQDDV